MIKLTKEGKCKMKKIISLVAILMLLCGCSIDDDFDVQFIAELEQLASEPIANLANNNKPLYRYYISPEVGRRYSSMTSSVFVYRDEEFIMNLDIATIINSEYQNDEIEIDTSESILTSEGQYLHFSQESYGYSLLVFETSDNKYFVELNTEFVDFYAHCEYTSIDDLVLEMMKIAKTVSIEEEEIVAVYSSKTVIEAQKEQVELFDIIIPEAGRIEELLGDGSVPETTTTTTTTTTTQTTTVQTDEDGNGITDSTKDITTVTQESTTGTGTTTRYADE